MWAPLRQMILDTAKGVADLDAFVQDQGLPGTGGIRYGSGAASGQLYSDDVQMAGFVVQNQGFGAFLGQGNLIISDQYRSCNLIS